MKDLVKSASEALDTLNYELDFNHVFLPKDAAKEFKACRDLLKQQQENISAAEAARITKSVTAFTEKGALSGNISLLTILKNRAGQRPDDIKRTEDIVNQAAIIYGSLHALMENTGKGASYERLIKSSPKTPTP